MHPSKFFKEVDCRISIELGEVYDNRLKAWLQTIHPLNILHSEIYLPFYRVRIAYDTAKEVHKERDMYVIMSTVTEDGEHHIYAEIQAEMSLADYRADHPHKEMRNLEMLETEHICDLVLRVG